MDQGTGGWYRRYRNPGIAKNHDTKPSILLIELKHWRKKKNPWVRCAVGNVSLSKPFYHHTHDQTLFKYIKKIYIITPISLFLFSSPRPTALWAAAQHFPQFHWNNSSIIPYVYEHYWPYFLFPLFLAKTYLPAVRAAKCLENIVFLILIFSYTISTVKEKFSDQRGRGQYIYYIYIIYHIMLYIIYICAFQWGWCTRKKQNATEQSLWPLNQKC